MNLVVGDVDRAAAAADAVGNLGLVEMVDDLGGFGVVELAVEEGKFGAAGPEEEAGEAGDNGERTDDDADALVEAELGPDGGELFADLGEVVHAAMAERVSAEKAFRSGNWKTTEGRGGTRRENHDHERVSRPALFIPREESGRSGSVEIPRFGVR